MTAFALALAAFVFIHVGLSATGLRAAAVRAIGEWPYRGAFSATSAILLVGVVWTYGQARFDPGNVPLWSPPAGMIHATYLIAGLGVTLAFAGLFTPGPTLVGAEAMLKRPDPARGVLAITRHPFLWGVSLWGLGHALANPELAPTLLFLGLANMCLVGTRSIDRKGRGREGWEAFEAVTSNVPFAAILQGRANPNIGQMILPLLAGAALSGLVLYAHPLLFGVAALRG
jgi:uncharacterized membrane protein